MYQVIIVVHVLLGLSVIGLILMQQGKGADAGAAFGSGSSGSVFGAQGAASFLSRTTAILATLFFTTSLTLAVLSGKQSKTVDFMDSIETVQKTTDVPSASKTATPELLPVTENAPEASTVPASEIPVIAGDEKTAIPSATETPAVSAETKAVDDKPAVDSKSSKADENKKVESENKSHDSAKSDKKKDSGKKESDKHAKKHTSNKKDE